LGMPWNNFNHLARYRLSELVGTRIAVIFLTYL
jgi:hypothetical protein